MDANNKNDLIIANKQLAFQNQQKDNRILQLVTDNKKLVIQNDENKKCITELKNNNKKLTLDYLKNKKCHEDLIIVHENLISQNKNKEKQSAILSKTNDKLKNAKETQNGYIEGLESILFMTSHKIRQPIANILGLSSLLNDAKNSNDETKVFIEFIKQSALVLDVYTQELTAYTFDLKKKVYLENNK
ncbi:hypothetical protein [Flavobacterium sp. N3904]|uniref:hypothetical protein n=1 Tax=Flavobacterium sp. N3904 TaxID=2986835 RepID=UPI0022259734|nr:hypothetical protein [Flavobacterium sp. N3904]